MAFNVTYKGIYLPLCAHLAAVLFSIHEATGNTVVPLRYISVICTLSKQNPPCSPYSIRIVQKHIQCGSELISRAHHLVSLRLRPCFSAATSMNGAAQLSDAKPRAPSHLTKSPHNVWLHSSIRWWFSWCSVFAAVTLFRMARRPLPSALDYLLYFLSVLFVWFCFLPAIFPDRKQYRCLAYWLNDSIDIVFGLDHNDDTHVLHAHFSTRLQFPRAPLVATDIVSLCFDTTVGCVCVRVPESQSVD